MPYKNPEDEIKWRTSDFGRKWIKEWNLKNKEKLREYYKRWEIENKEKRKEQHQERYKKNKEHHKKIGKIWREQNKEKIRDHGKKWRNENKENIAIKSKIYREKNKEIIKNKSKLYHLKNKERQNKRVKLNYQKNKEKIKLNDINDRMKVYNHYSNYNIKCNCCGEKHIDFLSIDHIDNNGYEQRKKGISSKRLIKWIIKNNYPSGFQISCMNCNHGRSRNPERICVHQKELSEKILKL